MKLLRLLGITALVMGFAFYGGFASEASAAVPSGCGAGTECYSVPSGCGVGVGCVKLNCNMPQCPAVITDPGDCFICEGLT